MAATAQFTGSLLGVYNSSLRKASHSGVFHPVIFWRQLVKGDKLGPTAGFYG